MGAALQSFKQGSFPDLLPESRFIIDARDAPGIALCMKATEPWPVHGPHLDSKRAPNLSTIVHVSSQKYFSLSSVGLIPG